MANRTTEQEQRSGAYVLEQLETKLEDLEQRLLELNSFGEKITREYNEKVGAEVPYTSWHSTDWLKAVGPLCVCPCMHPSTADTDP